MKITILAGGKFDREFFMSWLVANTDSYFIGADAGAKRLLELGIRADIAVGDFDSVSSDEKSLIEMASEKTIVLNPVKDDTDMERAIREALKLLTENRNLSDNDIVTIFGATGTRIDHLLANISLLKIFLDKGIKAYILDQNNRIRLLKANELYYFDKKEEFGKYVSYLPFSEEVRGLYLTGFKYDTDGIDLKFGNSLGVSNEILAEKASLIFDSGSLIMIESRD